MTAIGKYFRMDHGGYAELRERLAFLSDKCTEPFSVRIVERASLLASSFAKATKDKSEARYPAGAFDMPISFVRARERI